MIGIHPVHRRMAELSHTIKQRRLTYAEQLELAHCLDTNAKLVRRLDELKQLAYAAQLGGDMEWVQEICKQIDDLEVRMI